jgi:hypothetical protein
MSKKVAKVFLLSFLLAAVPACDGAAPASQPGDACLCSGTTTTGNCVCNAGLVCNAAKSGSLPATCDRPNSDPNGTKCYVDAHCKSAHCVSGICCADACGAGKSCALDGSACAP